MALTISVSEIVGIGSNRLLGKHKSWGRVLLGEVATVLNGFAFKSSEFSNSGGLPLIRIRDIGKDRSETTYLGEYDSRYVVEAGDLLVGMDGDFNCARWCGPRGLLNQRVCKITLKSDIYLAKFLDYTLPGYLKAINDVTSSVTVKHLSSKSIEEIPLPLPPKEVQQILVAEIEKQFSRLDEAVANLKRVKANLKRYKASVLKAAVDGFLVPIKNRETTKIGEVADLVTKGSSPNWQGFTYADSGVVFVRSQNVGWGNLDLSDVAHLPPAFNEKERKSVLRTGDVLLNIVGASIGRAAVATPEIEGGNVNQAVAVIRLNKERMLPKFLMLNLLSPGTQAAIHAEKVDVARANISLSDIKDFSILFPSLAEQGTMVAEVERLLSVTDEIEITVEANLKRAERLHQSILQQAFSGQLVPEDLNAEPVSVLLESVRVESLLEEPRSTLRQREASIKEADLTMANMIEALKSDWITAQEAFRLCGVGDGTETDAIERVYEELRDYIGSGRIAVDRRGEEDWLRLSQQLEA